MLADSLESAARTLDDPTPARLKNLVEDIINRKVADGQLDECDITLADLNRIKLSLSKSLAALYHTRIKYDAPAEETSQESK